MRVNCASSPSETPAAPDHAASQPPSGRRFGKRVYVVLGIVAVVAVVLALVFVFLAPLNVGATIPLSYDYASGEEMTYNVTVTATNATGQNTTETITIGMDVISFDGENYTVNETVALSFSGGSPTVLSVTEKVNKTGYVTYLNGTAGLEQAYFTFSNIWSFRQKTEARVGETWQIPFGFGVSNGTFNGILTYKFGDIQNITVPAGTYRVFKIDISGSNLTATTIAPPPANMSISQNITINGQMYLEYGTCRLIQADFQGNTSTRYGDQTIAGAFSEQIRLTKHIKH
jgi:hypothetical protein